MVLIIICFVRFLIGMEVFRTPKQLLSLDALQTQKTSYCNLPTGSSSHSAVIESTADTCNSQVLYLMTTRMAFGSLEILIHEHNCIFVPERGDQNIMLALIFAGWTVRARGRQHGAELTFAYFSQNMKSFISRYVWRVCAEHTHHLPPTDYCTPKLSTPQCFHENYSSSSRLRY
jgi:hypothetical protein